MNEVVRARLQLIFGDDASSNQSKKDIDILDFLQYVYTFVENSFFFLNKSHVTSIPNVTFCNVALVGY